MSKEIRYRPDIDGLRAIAILPVLLYHAGVPFFTGGYVGVDVFFVISGYLITGIIAREIDEQRFSIIGFYERRARRIMPTLIATIVAVLIGAACLYLPDDFRSVPTSALAATFFVSNLFFFHETGYFQGGAETKPLLHTWSLAIEEQFYIGFPILLILIARFCPRWRTPIVGGIALLSFALAVMTQASTSGFAFYMLPARAWELFAGALLALRTVPQVRAPVAREGVALLGLAAIAYAVFRFDKHTIFPGVTALYPVLGTAALLHCAPGTRVGRLLSARPLVAVGLVSYSLYLWHWPLIVFTQYATDTPLAGWPSLAVIGGALLLATLSWRFIEAPFRDRRRIRRGAIFGITGAAMVAVSTAAVAMVALHGWPSRFAPAVLRFAAGADDISPDRDRCHDSDAAQGRPPCTLGAPGAAPSALLWGDSHGVELGYVLSGLEAREGRALIERTQSSCPPLIGYDPPDEPRCAAVNREVLAAIQRDLALRDIYLAGFWASYQTVPGFAGMLDRTVAALVAAHRRVVLIGPIPSNDYDVPRRLAHLAQFGLSGPAGSDYALIQPVDAQLRAIATRWQGAGVRYLSPADRLCRAGLCAIDADGAPLYFDHHHLSVTGARVVLAGWQPG